MKMHLLTAVCILAISGFAQAEEYVCTTKSAGLSFSTPPMASSKRATSEAIAICSANLKTTNMECTSNVKCETKGVSNVAAGIEYECKTMSRGKSFLTKDANYDQAKEATLNACNADRNTENDECNRALYCKQIEKVFPFNCYIDKVGGPSSRGMSLQEAIDNTIKASGLPVQVAKSRLYCYEDKKAAVKVAGHFKCETKADSENIATEGSSLDWTASSTLASCYKKSANAKVCDTELTCEGDEYPRQKYYQDVQCSTVSAGNSLVATETRSRNLGRQVMAQCEGDSRMDMGECRANLICDGKRVSRKIYRCTINTNSVQVSTVDSDPSLAENKAKDICDKKSTVNDDPACRAQLKCEELANDGRVQYKNTLSGGR